MKEIDSNRAIKDTFKVVLDTFTLSQGYKCTCELMLMRWCIWYGAIQKCNDEKLSTFSGLGKLECAIPERQPLKNSLEVINRQGFKQEDFLKGFGVMNQQFHQRWVLSSVDEPHSEFGGKRNPSKRAILFKILIGSVLTKRNHHKKKVSMLGCKFTNRSIDSESTVVSSYTQIQQLHLQMGNSDIGINSDLIVRSSHEIQIWCCCSWNLTGNWIPKV
jgi:hypothetical protein